MNSENVKMCVVFVSKLSVTYEDGRLCYEIPPRLYSPIKSTRTLIAKAIVGENQKCSMCFQKLWIVSVFMFFENIYNEQINK